MQTLISNQTAHYYALTASNHDRIYDRVERQQDLARMRTQVAEVLRGHSVLELACGTGFWTREIATTATSVLATDINPEMIALGKLRALPQDKVQFALADAFDLPADLGTFSAVFAGMWWSHVKREDQEKFLGQLRAKFGKDLFVVFVDDCYVDGSSDTIARTDLEGNTFHIKTATDGQRYEVIKNYPSDSTLRKKMASSVREIRILRLEHYWQLSCRLK